MNTREQASFLADKVVRRQARKNGIELPDKYWNLATWKKPFHLQLIKAVGLLKLYDFEILKKALDSEKGVRVYSLGASWLDEIIEQTIEKEKLKSLREPTMPKLEVSDVAPEDVKRREQFNKKKTGLEGLD